MGGSKISSAVISIAPIFSRQSNNLFIIHLHFYSSIFFYNISSSCCRSLRRRSIIARMQIPRNRAVQTFCTSFQVVIAFVLLAECICLHCKIYLSQLKKAVSKLGCKFAEADRSRLGIDQLGLSALPWSLSSPFQK